MVRLVIAPLRACVPGRVLEGANHICLCDVLDIRIARQGIIVKVGSVEVRQRVSIGEEPGLHALNHQMDLIIGDGCGLIPVVTSPQVLPRRVSRVDRALGVNQEHDEGTSVLSYCRAEIVERRVPTTTGDHPGEAPRGEDLPKELREALAAPAPRLPEVTATLHVDADAQWRLPPISPLVQS